MLIILGLVTALLLIVVHELARRAFDLIEVAWPKIFSAVAASEKQPRLNSIWVGLAKQFPAACAFVANRFKRHETMGMSLTLAMLAGAYLIGAFSGLTEDILESDGLIAIDTGVNQAFAPWRVGALVSMFSWITTFGDSAAVVLAVALATAFLWSQRTTFLILPMWVTCFGAIATSSVGKFLIGRTRPDMQLDITVISSSFPSGHATMGTAVYGIIAYIIACALPLARQRFEVAFWTIVFIFMIGFSRIFLGVHFLTDVIGGFIVGGFWLVIGLTFSKWNQPSFTSPDSAEGLKFGQTGIAEAPQHEK